MLTLAHTFLSSFSVAVGRNLIIAFFLSLSQVHSDIPLKDEVCLKRDIRWNTFTLSLDCIVYHQMIDTYICCWHEAILSNSSQHLLFKQPVRMGLRCWLVHAVHIGENWGIDKGWHKLWCRHWRTKTCMYKVPVCPALQCYNVEKKARPPIFYSPSTNY